MRALICGAGNITRELLKRLGGKWRVTLVDTVPDKLSSVASANPAVARIQEGDASSPVVLDRAGIADCDYVLAMTGDDASNLAIARHAKEKDVPHVFALVDEPDMLPDFERLGAMTMLVGSRTARVLYHYLEDPRVNVLPLTLGQGEVLEVDAAPHFAMVGRKAAELGGDQWRAVALFREGELMFPGPDTVVMAEDKLVIVGRPDQFKPVCELLECGRVRFPMAYGRRLLLAPSPDHAQAEADVSEVLHLTQNTQMRELAVLCGQDSCGLRERLAGLSQSFDIEMGFSEAPAPKDMVRVCRERHVGLAVTPPFETPFFASMTKPAIISLAHSLPCPLLILRHTQPYRRILVPFNATKASEAALAVAADMAEQFQAEVVVAVVQEPGFLHGATEEGWAEEVLKQVRRIGHIHKFEFKEEVRWGNPVSEVRDLSRDFNLLVMGSSTKEKGLFSPHVGELIVSKAACSVLVIT